MAKTSSAPAKRRTIYLVDGSGYVYRAYHALPPLTRKRDGMPVGAVVGFCNMLNKLIEDHFGNGDGTHIAVIFDKGEVTFRNDIYKEYKANRDETPDDLIPQFKPIRDATRAFNIASIEQAGFEADDIIATYARIAREAGEDVVIVSSDKDLMQLVGDGVTMFDPLKSRPIGRAEVIERFGVGPERVVDVQSLAGDSTDNVPGVPGIGVKTAALLINEFGDLDTLLRRATEIKQEKRRENLIQFADQARLSRELVKLRSDVPVEESLDDLQFAPSAPDKLLPFLEDMEFSTLAKRIRARDGASPTASTPAISDGATNVATKGPGTTAHTVVADRAVLKGWADRARLRGALALHPVFSGPSPLRDRLIGLGLCIDPGTAAYVPIAAEQPPQGGLALEGGAAASLTLRDVIGELEPVLSDAGVLKIAHDAKVLLVAFANHEQPMAPIEDTMVLSYDLEAGLHAHDLESVAPVFLDRTLPTLAALTGSGKNARAVEALAATEVLPVAAGAADAVRRLAMVLHPRLVPARATVVYETIDRPLLPVLADMERLGIRVEPTVLKEQSRAFADRMVALEKEIEKLAGRPFNVGSPKQLGEILFENMGLAGGKKGKSGAYSTGADVLEALAAEGVTLAERVLDWREVSKLKNTYTDKLPEEINPATGRIHTTFDVAVANTGRLSSNDPNLQNIPIRTEEGRKIRRAFVPDRGHQLLSADYSQIELRLLAHMADIPQLTRAFQDGTDIHALTASEVFGVPVKGMDPAVRRRAKAINFGIIYGISPFGLARQLGIAQSEARDYINAYFQRFPGIRGYMEEQKELCRKNGWVKTIFGRRVHLPGIREKNPAARAFAERQAINAPLQGAAADIIKRAMIRLPESLGTAQLRARMLLQVHDELVFEVPAGETKETADLVKQVMEGVAHLKVPLVVETGIGGNWDEAH
ncbi:MAG: DNA polymerase I [Alphaproteobacteria bacterium]|nr:DNA polymerase I [Alphaproteobacteria bacterium]